MTNRTQAASNKTAKSYLAPKHKVIRIEVDGLRPHPSQAAAFADLSDDELGALAENMESKGLENPIQILPDGTIITGHQRVRAAKLLGWTHIDAVVRHDVADAGPAAALELLIDDNVLRRHMGPMAMARAFAVLKMQVYNDDGRRIIRDRVDIRDRLAKRFGRSGRQMDRLARLLELPLAIQDAVDCKRLTVAAATQLLVLGEAERKEIARLMADGGDARAIVRSMAPKPDAKCIPRSESISTAVGLLATATAEIKKLEIDAEELNARSLSVIRKSRETLAPFVDTEK